MELLVQIVRHYDFSFFIVALLNFTTGSNVKTIVKDIMKVDLVSIIPCIDVAFRPCVA